MKNISVWLITAKTNLHVGNENTTSYGIIDNMIQRNVVTGLPCIYSSSLKGAIKEFITDECRNKKTEITEEDIIRIFGSIKPEQKNKTANTKNPKEENKYQKGEAIFFDANLLMLPKQDDEELFKLVTSEKVSNQMTEMMKMLGMSEENIKKIDEEIKKKKKSEEESNNDLLELCNDENLPIIARNRLDNGESKNLWYEQVLPAETVLITFIASEDNKLEKALNGKIVQIGANATIGYGYCKFEKIN